MQCGQNVQLLNVKLLVDHPAYSWYSFLLEAESTPGPLCGRKGYVNEKFK